MKFFILTCLFLLSFGVIAQEKATLSGTIKDGATGEEMIGASIKVKDQLLGTITNEYGFFSITLPKGNYIIVFSSIDYKPQEKSITLNENIQMEIQLEPVNSATQIEEVTVEATRPDAAVKDPIMGVEKLDPKEIAKIPVIFGEKDLIKTMQLLPGVKNAGEGSSGFYVRGGSADQNLILLDEAPVYNASH